MKMLRCLTVLGLFLAATAARSAEDAVPEIRIMFSPSSGYAPADGVAPVYQFIVIGLLPGVEPSRPAAVSTEMLLKPGHTRQVYREDGNLKLEGNVKVDEHGMLMYRVAFLRGGVRIATSSSSVAWTEPVGQTPFSIPSPK